MSRGSLVAIVGGGLALGLDRITELLPVPEITYENDHLDWDGVEARIGLRLPEVYKEFVSTYGTGAIGNFLWVVNPFSSNTALNFDRVEYYRDAYRYLRQRHPHHYPKPAESYFPWGISDNGDDVVWVLDDGDPNDWIVGLQDSGQEETGLNTRQFLEALLEQTLTTSMFPADFVDDTRYFTPANPNE